MICNDKHFASLLELRWNHSTKQSLATKTLLSTVPASISACSPLIARHPKHGQTKNPRPTPNLYYSVLQLLTLRRITE